MDDGTPEEWRSVVDHEGLYLVSDHGNVYSVPRAKTKGGILRPCVDKQGRLAVNLTLNGKQKTRRVHQLVMEAFAGPPKPGQEIRHLDGNPANNRWTPGATEEEVRANGGNLFYGSHAENMADMAEHGTHPGRLITRCPQGHEYTPENTIRYNGGRHCRECNRIGSLERYHENYVHADPAVTCGHCGKPFDREPGKPRQKFCSQECRVAGGWQARPQAWIPAAELTPEERERRNAAARERLRRSRARQREARQARQQQSA